MLYVPKYVKVSAPSVYELRKHFYFFFTILFIYLTERESESVHTQAGRVAGRQRGVRGEGEAGLPLSREPDAGLDPRILGS